MSLRYTLVKADPIIMHELRKQSPLDEKSKGVTHPDTRMLSITVAPTAIPANSPTCSKQKRERDDVSTP